MDVLMVLAGAAVWYIGKKGESPILRIMGGLIMAAGVVLFISGLIVACSIMGGI